MTIDANFIVSLVDGWLAVDSAKELTVVFLARIACRYLTFELSVSLLEQAQTLLLSYFESLEEK